MNEISVDLVYLIDTTNSMKPCIDIIKTSIASFVDQLTIKDTNSNHPVKLWRAKAIGFRGLKVHQASYAHVPFVETPKCLRAQLSTLKAEGGTNEPTSLLDAIYRVATMPSTAKDSPSEADKWQERSKAVRLIVTFTAETYHPIMEQPKGRTVEDVVNAMHSNKIILNLFAPEMLCHDELAKSDKSEYFAIPSKGRPLGEALANFFYDQTFVQRLFLDQLRKFRKNYAPFSMLER